MNVCWKSTAYSTSKKALNLEHGLNYQNAFLLGISHNSSMFKDPENDWEVKFLVKRTICHTLRIDQSKQPLFQNGIFSIP